MKINLFYLMNYLSLNSDELTSTTLVVDPGFWTRGWGAE